MFCLKFFQPAFLPFFAFPSSSSRYALARLSSPHFIFPSTRPPLLPSPCPVYSLPPPHSSAKVISRWNRVEGRVPANGYCFHPLETYEFKWERKCKIERMKEYNTLSTCSVCQTHKPPGSNPPKTELTNRISIKFHRKPFLRSVPPTH